MNSISDREPKPCFRSLQDEVTRDLLGAQEEDPVCLPHTEARVSWVRVDTCSMSGAGRIGAVESQRRELPTQPGKVRKLLSEMATMSQDKKDVTIRRKSRASSGPDRDAWRVRTGQETRLQHGFQ